MSEKKVEERILLGSHLGDEFVQEVVTFCFEGKEGNLVLYVVSPDKLGLKQSILELQS